MLCKHCKKPLNESQVIGDYKSCPSCSTNSKVGGHIFYPKNAFGFTEKRETTTNPDGIHSWCTQCRSDNIGPHPGGIKCSDMPLHPTNGCVN